MRLLMWVLLAVVAGAAAVLSFSALRDLALTVGFDTELAWLLPITIDAGAAAGCLVWLAVDGTTEVTRRFARNLTWALLVGSVAGNAVEHGLSAYGLVATWWLVVLVSAVPPAVLGAVVHLAVLVRQRDLPVVVADLPVVGDVVDHDNHDLPLDNQVGDEVVDRARELVAGGAGRRTLAKELDLSDHHARQLLSQVRETATTNGVVTR